MGYTGAPLLHSLPSVVPQIDRVRDQPCVAQNKGDSFLSGHPQGPFPNSGLVPEAQAGQLLDPAPEPREFSSHPSSALTPDWIRAPRYNPYCGLPLLRD